MQIDIQSSSQKWPEGFLMSVEADIKINVTKFDVTEIPFFQSIFEHLPLQLWSREQ